MVAVLSPDSREGVFVGWGPHRQAERKEVMLCLIKWTQSVGCLQGPNPEGFIVKGKLYIMGKLH